MSVAFSRLLFNKFEFEFENWLIDVRRVLSLPEHDRSQSVVDDGRLLGNVDHSDCLQSLVPRTSHQVALRVSGVSNDARHLDPRVFRDIRLPNPDSDNRIHTLRLKKTCTPKAGRHKFIKISSPTMIFHTRHRHSVADRLHMSSKSLVRVKYQLQGFHGNQAPNNRMQLFITERNRRRRRLIYCP